MQRDDISRISNAVGTSAFQNYIVAKEVKPVGKKDIPKLLNTPSSQITKPKLPEMPGLSRLTARDHVINTRVPISKILKSIDKNLRNAQARYASAGFGSKPL